MSSCQRALCLLCLTTKVLHVFLLLNTREMRLGVFGGDGVEGWVQLQSPCSSFLGWGGFTNPCLKLWPLETASYIH